ncbi:MAG TPA: hypothetical protein VLE48_01395 [Terriglobales bacterium]|nr:hypothetical protein [Terriglobales bacterium]
MKKLAVLLLLLGLMVPCAIAQDTPKALSLPSGTGVRMKLETTISTSGSKAGDTFAGRVTEAVVVDGKPVIPVGSAIEGQIVSVSEPRRVKGRPTIHLRPNLLTLPNGERYDFNAVVVDTDRSTKTEVTEEGQIKGQGASKGDKLEIAAGTGAGMTVGAIAGGGKGALVGATIGAAATVTHWLTKRKTAELPAGSEIVMELSRPMLITASSEGK